MKFLVIATSFLFSIYTYANENQDLTKMLADSHCVPHRGADGKISGHKCDGPLGEKMKNGKFENIGLKRMGKLETVSGVVSANGEAVNSPAKAMELYNSMPANERKSFQRSATISDKFKSCLAGLYSGQISYHQKSGMFSATPTDFGLDKNQMCKGLEVSVDYANQNEFKVIAKAKDHIWSVDQTKTIEQIR